MIERLVYPLVLFSMLSIVFVETNILKTGMIITIGINIAMIVVFLQTIALLYGFIKSLVIFYKSERYPLYSPIRTALIKEQQTTVKREMI